MKRKENNHIFNINFNINKNKSKPKSIFDEIKISSLRKKYLKILKFLNSKNISINDIEFKKKLHGKDNKVLIPHFTCYHPNYVKNQENVLLVVAYDENKSNAETHKEICREYFYNLNNLFFILIFDCDLNATLYFRKEEDNQTYLMKIKEKYIAKFH